VIVADEAAKQKGRLFFDANNCCQAEGFVSLACSVMSVM
jgi:hypothetical protein